RRADGQTVRSEDVALLAIGVVQQGDAGGAVRIVFDRRHLRRDAVLVALEVDGAVLLLVTAADEAGADATRRAAPAGLHLPLRQRLLGRRLGDLIERVMRLKPDARRCRFVILDWHSVLSFSPSWALHAFDEVRRLLALFEPHVRLAPVAAPAGVTAHPLDLSADVEEANLFDLDLEQLFDRG